METTFKTKKKSENVSVITKDIEPYPVYKVTKFLEPLQCNVLILDIYSIQVEAFFKIKTNPSNSSSSLQV